MPYPTQLPGDLQVPGAITCGFINLPDYCVGNINIIPNQPILPQNTINEHVKTFQQPYGTAAVAQRQVLHVANGAGALLRITAGITVAAVGGATVTVDFYNNGVSVLSSTMTLNNTNAPFGSELGAFNSGDLNYSQYNVFEVVITVSAGGGTLPQGLWVQLVFQEANI
jgi:hypothetical protein